MSILSGLVTIFKRTFETILQKGAGDVMRGKTIPDNLARFLKKVDIKLLKNETQKCCNNW